VIGITTDDLGMTRRFMTSTPEGRQINYPIAVGGADEYGVKSFPYAYLIGPDGKVAWQGSGGSTPDKQIKALLKQVKKPDQETREARASKNLAFAASFADDRLYYRADFEYEQLIKRHPGTRAAEQAKESRKELSAGDKRLEFETQKRIASILGGVEMPKGKLKKKKAAGMAKKLRKLADENETKAPRAAKLADKWAGTLENPWR